MNWYKRKVLPKLLDKGMGTDKLASIRMRIVGKARGVVLEIGSGPGYNFQHYKNVDKLYLLEPSKELIEISKKRTAGGALPVVYLNAKAEKIPLEDSSVDTVVSTWTMCSVEDPLKVLNEIKRVLKPGGQLIFIEHGASPKILVRFLQSSLSFVTKYFTGNCHYDRDFKKMIDKTGFRRVGIDIYGESLRPLVYNYEGVVLK